MLDVKVYLFRDVFTEGRTTSDATMHTDRRQDCIFCGDACGGGRCNDADECDGAALLSCAAASNRNE